MNCFFTVENKMLNYNGKWPVYPRKTGWEIYRTVFIVWVESDKTCFASWL